MPNIDSNESTGRPSTVRMCAFVVLLVLTLTVAGQALAKVKVCGYAG